MKILFIKSVKHFLFVFIALSGFATAYSQNSGPVVITIGGNKIPSTNGVIPKVPLPLTDFQPIASALSEFRVAGVAGNVCPVKKLKLYRATILPGNFPETARKKPAAPFIRNLFKNVCYGNC